MTITYSGPFIQIRFESNEVSDKKVEVKLADGYTYNQILISNARNIALLSPDQTVASNTRITFPIINCKSPSVLPLYILDTTKAAQIILIIEKFGQIPDQRYFEKAFVPIIVTGGDGKKYRVIPSDQFK